MGGRAYGLPRMIHHLNPPYMSNVDFGFKELFDFEMPDPPNEFKELDRWTANIIFENGWIG